MNKNTKIIIKSNGNIEKRSDSFRHSSGFDQSRMSANHSDILSMRDSNQNPLKGATHYPDALNAINSTPGRNNYHVSKTMEKASLKQSLSKGSAQATAAQIINSRTSPLRASDFMGT